MQEPIPEEVIEQLQKIQHRRESIKPEDTLALLKKQLHQLWRVFICIDAVDELEPKVRQELLTVLQELVMTENDNVRLFLTGRIQVESEVKEQFKVAQGYTVNVSASPQDIREFVRQQIKKDLNPGAMDERLTQEIIDTITKKSQGM